VCRCRRGAGSGSSRRLRGKGVFKRFDRLRPCRIFAYYLGGLKPDDEDPGEAEARALNYKSRDEYLAALLNGEKQEINKRFKKAARRLFAQADLDFDRRPARVLFAAFVRMIEELPEQWFNWLNSNLQEECRSAPMGTESQTPHEFFFLPQMTGLLRPPIGRRQGVRVFFAYLRKLRFRFGLRTSCGRNARPAFGCSADTSIPA
jgi:hypothetical protein